MRYLLILVIILSLFFSALTLSSCEILKLSESKDTIAGMEEVQGVNSGNDEADGQDEQYIQAAPENVDPESKETVTSSTDDQETTRGLQSDLMFYNSEVGFAFIYSPENLTLSSNPYGSVDNGDSYLSVSINDLKILEGSMEESALDERDALKNGNAGPDTDYPFEPSKKVTKIGDVFVKEYLVFERYGVCDVTFDRKAVFYNNGYQVQITLSADREKIQESMNQYFISDKANCTEGKVWGPGKQGEFYDKLIKGEASGPALEWYKAFDEIMYLLQINDFKGASAGYSRLIDKRYFEESREQNYIIDISYPQFQSAVVSGLDDSINKLIYDETVYSILNDFKDEVSSYEEENIDLDFELNYFLAIDYSIVMFDDKGISLCLDISPYMGGAHGMLYFKTMNFDLEKNNLIELEDLFVPEYDYLEIISKYCREDLKRQMNEIGAPSDEAWIKEGTDPFFADAFTNFLVAESGLIIKFPAYQVGPYAAGNFSVNIPYEHFEGNINPESMAAGYIN